MESGQDKDHHPMPGKTVTVDLVHRTEVRQASIGALEAAMTVDLLTITGRLLHHLVIVVPIGVTATFRHHQQTVVTRYRRFLDMVLMVVTTDDQDLRPVIRIFRAMAEKADLVDHVNQTIDHAEDLATLEILVKDHQMIVTERSGIVIEPAIQGALAGREEMAAHALAVRNAGTGTVIVMEISIVGDSMAATTRMSHHTSHGSSVEQART